MSQSARIQPLVGARHRAGGLTEVTALAAPVILQQISATAMMVVDSAMVGRLGATELAGVGFGSVWMWTLFAFFSGTASGAQTFVSQVDGAGRAHESGRWAWHALAFVLPTACLTVLVIAPLVAPALALLVPSEALRANALTYIGWRLPGEIALAAMMVFSSFFRGLGDTKTPMAVSIFANLLNAGLDYALIFGAFGLPALGVAGAAIATSIASVVGAALLFALFLRPTLRARFGTAPSRLDRDTLRRFLRTGLPIGGQWCIGTTTFAFFTTLIARMGDASMAASQAFVMLLCISYMQAVGISTAAQTLVGRYRGRGDEAATRRSLRSALLLGSLLAAVVAVVFLSVPGPLMRIFSDDPAVLALGRPLLAIGALFQLFDAIVTITQGALRGAGDTRWPFVFETTFGWIVFLPLAYALGVTWGYGLAGAWTGGLISLGCSAAVLLWRFESGAWRRIAI